MSRQTITLGGGCFWCLEAIFLRVQGVIAVESGYCNGHLQAPSYEQVCQGDSGHVEVVRVTFDAEQISLAELLEIFFHIHDPTTPGRQGNDVGSQYRSGIYWHDTAQEAVAQEVRARADVEMSALLGRPVVTEVLQESNYWPAEAYHQDYFAQHPQQGYCAAVVAPKVEKFKRTFQARLKPSQEG